MAKETIVIVGFGWVGQANALALSLMGHEVNYFDIGSPTHHYESEYKAEYEKLIRLKVVLDKDSKETTYIVCVGDRVDDEGNQDISNIKAALNSLQGTKGTIVLRSTILPGYLKDLNFDFYMPEFLHERYAVNECIHPHYFVLGRREKDRVEPEFFKKWRSNSIKDIDCSPEDASHIKYLSNLWNALRIAFTNEFGCTISEPESKDDVAHIEKVIRFLFEEKPYQRYGRSFGGHCLPKDMRAYTKWSANNGKHVPLFEGVLASNYLHRVREEKNNHLPEWFSRWTKPDLSGWVALEQLVKAFKRRFQRITKNL